MKRTLFALTLTICLAFAAFAFSVQADAALQLSVAAKGGDYPTVESALAAVETMAANGDLNKSGVKLILSGEHTAAAEGSILFGQKTIFLPDGTKLPIVITGGTLYMPEGNVACANDYTFDNITIPFDDVKTQLYAGTGNVTLKNVTLDLNGTEEYKSYFYADNFTANAFEGWTEQALALCEKDGLFTSSLTLGEGFHYVSSVNTCIAVGSSTDFSAKVGSKTLSADDTRAELIVNGATLKNVLARKGSAPVGNSVLHLVSGSIYHLHGTAPASAAEYTGDVTVLAEGGRLNHFIRILQKTTLNGNLSVTLKNVNLLENEDKDDARMIEIGFSDTSVLGNVTVTMENVKADRYYGSMAGKTKIVGGDLSMTAKNCEFTRFIRSGFGQSTICGNVENTLENVLVGPEFLGLDECSVLGKASDYTGSSSSVGNLTNRLKNVTFATPNAETNTYLGSKLTTGCAVAGNITNELENVTTQGKLSLYLANYAGTTAGNITNTVKSGSYNHYVYGGPYKGTVKGILKNNVEGGIYFQEVFLGGYACTISGKIENHISGGEFNTLYLYCGPRGGNVTNTAKLPYGIENYFTGGSFVGVWGGGGNTTTSTLTANIYNEISDGFFGVYNTTGKINSFAGSTRNGAHNANVDTLIRGGTFEGYVFGGSIPNQEDWSHQHKGTSTLTLAGGDFRYFVDADCRWGSYDESRLIVNTEKALQPLSFAYDLECESFVAASDSLVTT
ncbi:MAG: hypothetical protein IJC26_01060, partial [Clostridia bacterium]|nr:hypothetical protein [Clostridia bacterium]